MYQIAICDDDSEFREIFQKLVKAVVEDLGTEAKFLQWSTLEQAKNILQQGQKTDLLFLDIELNKHKGMELGRFIREDMLDFETQIVYVSHEQGYAMELFDTEPLGFLIKPVTKEMLYDVCRRFLRRQKKGKKFFYYKDRLETKVIFYGEILYFRSIGHKIAVCTKEGIQEFYGKLGEVEEQVPDYFLRIHKSFLVNSHYIQSYRLDKVILYNGEELIISRSYKEQVRAFVVKRLEEM